MLLRRAFRSFSANSFQGQLALLRDFSGYSSRSDCDSEAADLDAARQWFQHFNTSTIPAKIAKTTFSRSSGPGGQKTNKYAANDDLRKFQTKYHTELVPRQPQSGP